MIDDKQILLEACDGPEGICIYTSTERGINDWAGTTPTVYVDISLWGASATFGPFTLGSIYQQLRKSIPLPPEGTPTWNG